MKLILSISVIGIVAFLLLTSVSPFKNHVSQQLYPKTITKAAFNKQYELGIGYVSANRTTFDLNGAYDKIKAASDIAYIQGSWADWLNTNYFSQDIAMARSKGLKIYLALDILGYTPTPRASVDIPSSVGVSGDFTSTAVRAKYLEFVQTITQRYSPDYLVVLVEANLHKNNNRTSYDAYKSFYPTVYQAVKTISPSTKVTPSLVFGDITAPNQFDSLDLSRFQEDVADFDGSSDILAVSTYPIFLYTSTDKFPQSFVSDLAGYTVHPLFISETSWLSKDFSLPLSSGGTFTIKATEQDQSDYIAKLEQSAEYALRQGKKIEAINFVSLIDVTDSMCQAIVQQSPTLGWFCSLGLFRGDGSQKPAYQTLLTWNSQISTTIILGDLDQNGKVDIFDYNILVGNFNKTGSGVLGDIDNNGKVDIFDYNTLVGNFGK